MSLDAGHRCGTEEFSVPCTPDAGKGWDAGRRCGTEEFPVPCDASLCANRKVNNEPEILAGYSPGRGESVTRSGQIRVWVTDEWPEAIAPDEQIDHSSGRITAPGDRTATAPDGYLWEPALYIAPDTAASGRNPHFPQYIRGWYNNVPLSTKPRMGAHMGTMGADVETPPSGVSLSEAYDTEVVWDVSELGLKPGDYEAEFVIADGDLDRGVGCVTIRIE
jgi:hypothetical protein